MERPAFVHDDDPLSGGKPVEVGLFGKLPSHGDFLRRRASDAFVDAWDGWLRDCVAASREALGERWLELYLTSPAWRFACAANACGPDPVLGLMVPSVDRVGRYFPLTLVVNLPPGVNPIAATTAAATFFERAEDLIIETLATEDIDFDFFDEQVVRLGDALESLFPPRVVLDPSAAAIMTDEASWQVPIGSAADLGKIFEQLLWQRLSTLHDPLTLWWTEGSGAVEPSCLIAKGLPRPDTFVSMLDGQWASSRWRSVSAYIDPGATLEMRMENAAPIAFRSAAGSDVGLAREINEDSFVERPEIGVWAVADGLGGHRDGEIASHMVCDALAELVPDPTFEGTIDVVRERLNGVNEYLLRTGSQTTMVDRSASTVVVLLARGPSCAILWAGDSRLYRWRDGKLEQLTHDHSVENAGGVVDAPKSSTAITRAVGVQSVLTLDLLRGKVLSGDRFLLCSDGLTRVVPEEAIGVWMREPDVRAAVDGLIRATLDTGAPDNVTVVIAEAYR